MGVVRRDLELPADAAESFFSSQAVGSAFTGTEPASGYHLPQFIRTPSKLSGAMQLQIRGLPREASRQSQSI